MQNILTEAPLETLKRYIDQPSGSFDKEDVQKMAEIIASDFEKLGFTVELIPGEVHGPKVRATIGKGDKQLMLMGHMDTVFPHDVYVPFKDLGDGRAMGRGIIDMKGGVVILLHALKHILPSIDLDKIRLCAVINPDEEVGSPESHAVILETAKASFAALSFEPGGKEGRFTCARKGVTSVRVSCEGKPGHAGAEYTRCASAIQGLCAQITKLYALRDDSREISFNAGKISGGTAENVVAPHAECACEFRYFDERYKPEIMARIREIVAEEPVEGVTTSLLFGASHPAIDLNEKSQQLLDLALEITRAQGRTFVHEKTGGAGDISIAGQAGIGVLDGLGMLGTGMHTVQETADIASMPAQIALAEALIPRVIALA
ncbi:MAG: M20/M25/M40 family metallo-hydrolase [Clostridia bacterium]|nr:M20/M25/M40 family metallo-hydrolase [Clostridia bacterium]